VAHDAVEAPAFLAAHKAELEVAHEHWPKIRFHALREHAGLVFHANPVA
jgi:peptide chain release factor 3